MSRLSKKEKQQNTRNITLTIIGIILICILTFGLSFIFSFYYIINPDASIIPQSASEIEAENQELKTEVKNLESVIEQLETQLTKYKTVPSYSGAVPADTSSNAGQSTTSENVGTSTSSNSAGTTNSPDANNTAPEIAPSDSGDSDVSNDDDIKVIQIP